MRCHFMRYLLFNMHAFLKHVTLFFLNFAFRHLSLLSNLILLLCAIHSIVESLLNYISIDSVLNLESCYMIFLLTWRNLEA